MSSYESWDTRNYEWTDEQKKPAIEVGAPPKNQVCLDIFLGFVKTPVIVSFIYL